jgi:predicted lipoprotein with Yx(FWY)xxD motif
MAKSGGGTNILVDGASGMTLYVFASDTANSGKCTDWTMTKDEVPMVVSPRDVRRQDLLGGLIYEYGGLAA